MTRLLLCSLPGLTIGLMLLTLTSPLIVDWAKAILALLTIPVFGLATLAAFSTDKPA